MTRWQYWLGWGIGWLITVPPLCYLLVRIIDLQLQIIEVLARTLIILDGK